MESLIQETSFSNFSQNNNSNLREENIGLRLFQFEVILKKHHKPDTKYNATNRGILEIKNVTSYELESIILNLKDELGRYAIDTYSVRLNANVTSANKSQNGSENKTLSTTVRGICVLLVITMKHLKVILVILV